VSRRRGQCDDQRGQYCGIDASARHGDHRLGREPRRREVDPEESVVIVADIAVVASQVMLTMVS